MKYLREKVEVHLYELFISWLNRLIRGFYIFKKRRGELIAGAITFYVLLSFGPLLLLLIAIYSHMLGNVEQAFNQLMSAFKSSFPEMAPWVYSSIYETVQNILAKAPGLSWANSLLLLYGLYGLFTSLIFGISQLADRDSSIYFVINEIYSLLIGLFLALFFVAFFFYLAYLNYIMDLCTHFWGGSAVIYLIKTRTLLVIFSLVFFSFYYKFISPIYIRFTDAVAGALSFIALMALGKSCYWIYLYYCQQSIQEAYGNFYNIAVVVLWIYYSICAFFYGASVAFSPDSLKTIKFDGSPNSKTPNAS